MDFTAIAITLKGLLASATIVGGSHILRRSPFQQRRSMRRILSETQQQLAASPVYNTRHTPWAPSRATLPSSASRKLKDLLASPPKGPIVVTGAEGTGTSSVAGAALSQSGAPLLLRLNLRENPPSVGKRPFIRALMTSSGYFTRQREAVDLGLLNEGDSDTGLQYDVMTFLSRLTEVFQAEKVARDRVRTTHSLESLWSGLPSTERPLPVVFIDEIHAHPSLNKTDSDFATFLRWALFITDGQLAHVLLVARPEQIIRIEDGNAEFHAMRQRLVINYPPVEQVRNYLISESNGELSNELIDRIVSSIGGQLKNLRLFLSILFTIQRNRSCETSSQQQQHQQHHPDIMSQHGSNDGRVAAACEMLLEDLIADSKELVLRTWDRLVSDGNITSYKRALRFWEMAKVIADQEAVPRQAMVNQVFGPGKGVSASEIEEYVAAGLITYCSPLSEQGEGKVSPASGDLWLSAASPLIRGAFAYITNKDLAISHSKAVELELAKLQLQQRKAQLSKRVIEQSTQTRASAELLKVLPRIGSMKEEEDLGKMISMLGTESSRTLSELQSVRQEYDLLKWKNKWQ